jgi:hypothetical protein
MLTFFENFMNINLRFIIKTDSEKIARQSVESFKQNIQAEILKEVEFEPYWKLKNTYVCTLIFESANIKSLQDFCVLIGSQWDFFNHSSAIATDEKNESLMEYSISWMCVTDTSI